MMLSNFPEPYYKDEYCYLYKGNALDVLRQFPSDSVSCVTTSPPFFQLRAYGEETVVTWDGDEDCEHEFGEVKKALSHKAGETNPGKEAWYKDEGGLNDTGSAFCLKCGAWRNQLGNEPSVSLFMSHLLQIFAEVKRVLRPDGTCWVEIGDTHGGSGCARSQPPNGEHLGRPFSEYATEGNQKYTKGMEKSLLCMPFRFAIGMTDMGWLLRNTIVAWKRSCVPSSAIDRLTVDHSYLFFFTKSRNYWFQQQFEPARGKESYTVRNKRTVWDVTSQGLHEDHYAPFPETLVETPISAGCPEGGIVLDPFCGTSTTGVVAIRQRKFYVGIDPVQRYLDISLKRIAQVNLNQKTQDAIQENKPLQRMLF